MATLYPYIYSSNAREQAAFYAEALSGEIKEVRTFQEMPGADVQAQERVMHLTLYAAGVTFFMADVPEGVQRGNGLDLTLEFTSEAEARQAFERLSRGGKVLMSFEKMFWGAQFGRLEDLYGIRWQISAVARATQG